MSPFEVILAAIENTHVDFLKGFTLQYSVGSVGFRMGSLDVGIGLDRLNRAFGVSGTEKMLSFMKKYRFELRPKDLCEGAASSGSFLFLSKFYDVTFAAAIAHSAAAGGRLEVLDWLIEKKGISFAIPSSRRSYIKPNKVLSDIQDTKRFERAFHYIEEKGGMCDSNDILSTIVTAKSYPLLKHIKARFSAKGSDFPHNNSLLGAMLIALENDDYELARDLMALDPVRFNSDQNLGQKVFNVLLSERNLRKMQLGNRTCENFLGG